MDNLLIEYDVDKEPYIKTITDDKIINLTGESGSGKSTYSDKYKDDNNYIIIDTDILFSEKSTDNKFILDLRNIFSYTDNLILINNFDEFYIKVLDYFKDIDKTIIIDSAQYRNIKDYSILKGEVIVIRTSPVTCFERVKQRWINNHPNYDEDEYNKYVDRKKALLGWYESINNFILNVEKISCK
jgi:dephospho-CoA kinase